MEGKIAFVVGGSAGLGKEIAKLLASQGANITIFGRTRENLDVAKDEILAARKTEDQGVVAIQADMSNATEVQKALTSQPLLPDVLYCMAGGTAYELGYMIDLEAEQFERCMNNNYYSSLYPARHVLSSWVEDDKKAAVPKTPKQRSIVFCNSSASFMPIPGYIAYNAAKAAQRALADTLRLEAARYSGPVSDYKIQLILAHNFITPTFIEEQKHKPALTKRLEGTDLSLAELEKTGKFPLRCTISAENRGCGCEG
ncbi:hypothetical protein N0V90_000663 [Kalmusia sp. IMI 367209]|nr:hypothetical protein N0V90_000663 [Kalmusia sp. IMI 367209]